MSSGSGFVPVQADVATGGKYLRLVNDPGMIIRVSIRQSMIEFMSRDVNARSTCQSSRLYQSDVANFPLRVAGSRLFLYSRECALRTPMMCIRTDVGGGEG